MNEPNDPSPDLDVEALIDQELDRYGELLSPERRALYREMMLAVVTEHPIIHPMVERVRRRIAPVTSEERERASAEQQGEEAQVIKKPLRSVGGKGR